MIRVELCFVGYVENAQGLPMTERYEARFVDDADKHGHVLEIAPDRTLRVLTDSEAGR